MPCCGQKRNALKTNTAPSAPPAMDRQWPTPRPAPAVYPSVPAVAAHAYAVMLEYTESSPIVVEGTATRRRYEFSAAKRLQMVDSGDAETLLRTRFFVRR
jgi:hypothetical protein